MQYADDISEANTNKAEIEDLKMKIPNILSERGLKINDTKTEEYKITNNENKWKKCKLLGSYIDTEADISNRKGMFLSAAKQLLHILNHKRLPISVKIKTFNVYLSLYFYIIQRFGH